MNGVLPVKATVFLLLNPLRRKALVLARRIVAPLTLGAG